MDGFDAKRRAELRQSMVLAVGRMLRKEYETVTCAEMPEGLRALVERLDEFDRTDEQGSTARS